VSPCTVPQKPLLKKWLKTCKDRGNRIRVEAAADVVLFGKCGKKNYMYIRLEFLMLRYES